MSIPQLFKSMRDAILSLFRKPCCHGGCSCNSIHTVTPDEANANGLKSLAQLSEDFKVNRDTLRHRLISCGVRPAALLSTPRSQFLYDPKTFGPMFERYPAMKGNA